MRRRVAIVDCMRESIEVPRGFGHAVRAADSANARCREIPNVQPQDLPPRKRSPETKRRPDSTPQDQLWARDPPAAMRQVKHSFTNPNDRVQRVWPQHRVAGQTQLLRHEQEHSTDAEAVTPSFGEHLIRPRTGTHCRGLERDGAVIQDRGCNRVCGINAWRPSHSRPGKLRETFNLSRDFGSVVSLDMAGVKFGQQPSQGVIVLIDPTGGLRDRRPLRARSDKEPGKEIHTHDHRAQQCRASPSHDPNSAFSHVDIEVSSHSVRRRSARSSHKRQTRHRTRSDLRENLSHILSP